MRPSKQRGRPAWCRWARRVDWDSYREDPDVVVLADTVGKLF
jgi:hypothetical protein